MKYVLLLLLAMALVCPVSAQGPTEKRAHIDAVMKCVAKGDNACVVDLSTKGVEIYPTDSGFRYTRGVGYLGLGKYSEALADENKAIELNPQFSYAFYIRALVYETGYFDFDKALADLSTTLKLEPNSLDALVERGKLYKFQGHLDLSTADYQMVLNLDPSSATAKLSLADIADMKKAGFNTGPVKDTVLLLYTEYMRRYDRAQDLLVPKMDAMQAAIDEKSPNIMRLCSGVNGLIGPASEIEKNRDKLEALLSAGRFDKIPVYKAKVRKAIDEAKGIRGPIDQLNEHFHCEAHWPSTTLTGH